MHPIKRVRHLLRTWLRKAGAAVCVMSWSCVMLRVASEKRRTAEDR